MKIRAVVEKLAGKIKINTPNTGSHNSKNDSFKLFISISENLKKYWELNNISKKTLVDPYILKNTSEPMSSGFEPYTSGGSCAEESSDDNASVSSNDSE